MVCVCLCVTPSLLSLYFYRKDERDDFDDEDDDIHMGNNITGYLRRSKKPKGPKDKVKKPKGPPARSRGPDCCEYIIQNQIWASIY